MFSDSTLQQTAQPGERLGLRDQDGFGELSTADAGARRQGIKLPL
jgi:hypothetical protein